MEKLFFSVLPDIPRSCAVYFLNDFSGLTPYRFQEDAYDYEAEEEYLREYRNNRMIELVGRFGREAVIAIAPYVENKRAYATAIAQVVMNSRLDWPFVKQLRGINTSIASYVIAEAYRFSGLDALVETDPKPEREDMAWVLSCIPLTERVAEFVEKTGDSSCQCVYWENVNIWSLQNEDKETVDKYVETLLKHNRPFTLMNYLAYSKWNTPKLVIQILEAALKLYPDSEPNGLSLDCVECSHIQKMFKKLYSQEGLPELEIAGLELAYLRTFDQEFEPKFLVEQVLQQPALYMELIKTAYCPDNNTGVSPTQAHQAMQAYRALDRIQRIPGFNPENKIVNNTIFKKWIADVNELAKVSGYTHANEIALGRILSFAPVGNDGIWPHECVRQIFEQSSSETLNQHFILGKFNQRGVYVATGGKDEDKLSDKYASIADDLQLLSPRTSALIRQLSDQYRAQAKEERARELKDYV